MARNGLDGCGLREQFLVLQKGKRFPASFSEATIQLGNGMIPQHVIRVRTLLKVDLVRQTDGEYEDLAIPLQGCGKLVPLSMRSMLVSKFISKLLAQSSSAISWASLTGLRSGAIG